MFEGLWHFQGCCAWVLKRPPFCSAVADKARDATEPAGRVFGSKLPKMARFSPKIGVFRGVLFTTKVIGVPSIPSCKHLKPNVLSVISGRGAHRKGGTLWGRGVGVFFAAISLPLPQTLP